MNLKHLSLLIITILLASCSSIVSLTENVNSKTKFGTKEIYLETLNKRNQFSKDKIIILDDSMFNVLMNEIIYKHLSTYYGIVDKKHFVSAEQLNIKSCSGQIKFLYQMFIEDSKEIKKEEVTMFTILQKLNLDSSKNTLVFLYSYKLGGLSKNKINSVIKDLENEKNFDYRIISLDNYDIVNK